MKRQATFGAIIVILSLMMTACGGSEEATPLPTLIPVFTRSAVDVATTAEESAPAAEPTAVVVAAAATPEPPTPTAEPTAVVVPATPTPEPPTPTVEPTVAAEPPAQTQSATDDPLAGLPPEVAALMPGDAVRGQQLTLSNGCIGCHNVDPAIPMAGPTWHNVGATASTRVPGETAPLYLYNSIVHPNDYVVEGYVPGVMLQTYGQTLKTQDVADLIAYLLTLQGP